ncbi:polyprenol monophosphomannose synthase [Candidatus Micrarchaeota archaeon]|nr:polyprenol monophosphomannose synthase [Candidatus Micrarchaeota archaeon]
MGAIVVIPTFNEKENVVRLTSKVLAADQSIKILFVDDSSPDGTGKIEDRLAKKYKGRIYVLHRKGRGRGSAGIAGFKMAISLKPDCIIEMDADFSHDPKYIPQMLLLAKKGYDVIIGSRFVRGGKIPNRPWWRDALSTFANIYNWLMLGLWGIKDTSGGFKCYKRAVLEAIDFDSIISKGYSIGPETLYKIKKAGKFKFIEFPIIFNDRNAGNSKLTIKEYLRYIVTVFRVRFGL